MSVMLQDTALFDFVRTRSEVYADALLKLRDKSITLLSYIPSVFSHYPSHGIDHSDEIIRKMSAILFIDGDSSKPVAEELNEIEASILIAAAYTHDIGMVVSEDEIQSTLKSEKWEEFIANDDNARETWKIIEGIREGVVPFNEKCTSSEKLLIAGRYLRFLIAEFFRRGHSHRSASFLRLNHDVFGTELLTDRQFRDAVAKTGEAHGISYTDLQSDHTYPESTLIEGKPVNLRFLGIIMRFGDLLDMRSERSEATFRDLTTIPADSLPHWDQYGDFRDEVINYQKIAFTAYCPTQSSYRVLKQWCNWIEQESNEATLVMNRAKRHQDWCPPSAKVASVDELPCQANDKTIFIRPTEEAKFIPHDWKFYLNHNLILQRLTEDVYGNDPYVFIRELLQNALDASRAKLVQRLENDERTVPDWLPDASKHDRELFPIKMQLSTFEEEGAKKQAFIIEDKGLGMDEEIIKRYFLQVGQSFYTSEEFRSQFNFNATSRFGIGFLSVFGVSSNVKVTTYKGEAKGQPIQLTLHGAKDYLLTEEMPNKVKSGTRIEILIDNPLNLRDIVNKVQAWCGQVEFPVVLTIDGQDKPIKNIFFEELKIPCPDNRNDYFIRKTIPIKGSGIRGEIGVWHSVTGGIETLAYNSYYLTKAKEYSGYPVDYKSSQNRNHSYFHGIKSDTNLGSSDKYEFWYDLRSSKEKINLSRNNVDKEDDIFKSIIEHQLLELVKIELENYSSEDQWQQKNLILHGMFNEYKRNDGLMNKLLKQEPLIPVRSKHGLKIMSYEQLKKQKSFFYICNKAPYNELNNKHQNNHFPQSGEYRLSEIDLSKVTRLLVDEISTSIKPLNAYEIGGLIVTEAKLGLKGKRVTHCIPVKDCRDATSLGIPRFQGSSEKVINVNHPVGKWYSELIYCEDTPENIKALAKSNLAMSFSFMSNVKEWLLNTQIADKYRPPKAIDEYWEQYP